MERKTKLEKFKDLKDEVIEEDKDFYKVLVAIDEFRHIALLKDLKGNLNNISFKEIVYDCELMEDDLFDNLENGIYELVFWTWSWYESNENGSDGDGELEPITIKKINYTLK